MPNSPRTAPVSGLRRRSGHPDRVAELRGRTAPSQPPIPHPPKPHGLRVHGLPGPCDRRERTPDEPPASLALRRRPAPPPADPAKYSPDRLVPPRAVRYTQSVGSIATKSAGARAGGTGVPPVTRGGGAWTAGDHYFDRVFTNDNLNRLAKNDEGHKSGGTIASSKHTRIEEWTLSQTGNWDNQKLDLNGDGDQGDGSERDWNSTFNTVNEFVSRDGVTPTTPYDPVGNMIDDAKNYTYVYDVFGRLKTVKTRGGSPVTVSEYKYNGLGFRIGWHYDADTDSDVDGSDPWYWFFYDERWRIVATYRGSDSDPKERIIHHAAGFAGYGGSSYIDSVAFRDCDDSAAWDAAAPDDELQTRYYYLQNWRADVVALIQADGLPLEYVRYSPYGVPFVYSAADVNRDGAVDINDVYSWDDYYYSTGGDAAVDIDINRDGTADGTDATLVWDIDAWGLWAGSGRGYVSRLDSRKGYAGYEFDPATTQWHVRHRVLVSEMGRWGRRDPAGYIDSQSLYEYTASAPITVSDAMGLWGTRCVSWEPRMYPPPPLGTPVPKFRRGSSRTPADASSWETPHGGSGAINVITGTVKGKRSWKYLQTHAHLRFDLSVDGWYYNKDYNLFDGIDAYADWKIDCERVYTDPAPSFFVRPYIAGVTGIGSITKPAAGNMILGAKITYLDPPAYNVPANYPTTVMTLTVKSTALVGHRLISGGFGGGAGSKGLSANATLSFGLAAPNWEVIESHTFSWYCECTKEE